LYESSSGNVKCFPEGDLEAITHPNMLETYTKNGSILRVLDNIDTVRDRVNKSRRELNI